MTIRTPRSILLLLAIAVPFAPAALAHCDTVDGPVAVDAKTALAQGDIAPVLKWVRAADEPEVRAAFSRTLAVRKTGDAARDLADTWFLETLIRVHRAGEGAPYTGLKPAGSPVDPAVRLADRALEEGSVDTLVKGMTSHVAEGLQERFAKAGELRKRANDSVEAGRAYVAAYVEFVHYAEKLHQAAVGAAHEH